MQNASQQSDQQGQQQNQLPKLDAREDIGNHQPRKLFEMEVAFNEYMKQQLAQLELQRVQPLDGHTFSERGACIECGKHDLCDIQGICSRCMERITLSYVDRSIADLKVFMAEQRSCWDERFVSLQHNMAGKANKK